MWRRSPAPKTTMIGGELDDVVLDLAEAAELLRVSESDVRRWPSPARSQGSESAAHGGFLASAHGLAGRE